MPDVGQMVTISDMSTQHAATHVPQWTLGDRLRKAREDSGLSQSELAELLRVGRNTVSNAEVGARVPLRITIGKWAEVTAVPEEWLLTGEAPGAPTKGPGLPRLDSNQKPPGLRSLPHVA